MLTLSIRSSIVILINFSYLIHDISQIEEEEEAVWASSLSCLLYFVCDRGKIRRSRLKGLDIRVSILTTWISCHLLKAMLVFESEFNLWMCIG